jgi:hypothetical protein
MEVLFAIVFGSWVHASGYAQESLFVYDKYNSTHCFYMNWNYNPEPLLCIDSGTVLVKRIVSGNADNALPWGSSYSTIQNVSYGASYTMNWSLAYNKRISCWNNAERIIGTDKCEFIENGAVTNTAFRSRDWQDGYVYKQEVWSAR